MTQYDGQTYVGLIGGVDRVRSDGHSSHVTSVDGEVCSVSVNDGLIYTPVSMTDGWSVRVYDSNYQLIRLWRHNEDCRLISQLVVKKDSVLVPDRDCRTIVQYSLTGEVKRLIPCLELICVATWLCLM